MFTGLLWIGLQSILGIALLGRLLAAAKMRFTGEEAVATLAFVESRACPELHDDVERARIVLVPALRCSGHPQRMQIMAYARALARM